MTHSLKWYSRQSLKAKRLVKLKLMSTALATTGLSYLVALFGYTERRKFTWLSAEQLSSGSKLHYFIELLRILRNYLFCLKYVIITEDFMALISRDLFFKQLQTQTFQGLVPKL